MEMIRGRSVLNKTAVGKLQYYEQKERKAVRQQVEDAEREALFE